MVCIQDLICVFVFLLYTVEAIITRQSVFDDTKEGYALLGHVIEVRDVRSSGNCVISCTRHEDCLSVNYYQVMKKCEFNGSDRFINSESLLSRKDSSYIGMKAKTYPSCQRNGYEIGSSDGDPCGMSEKLLTDGIWEEWGSWSGVLSLVDSNGVWSSTATRNRKCASLEVGNAVVYETKKSWHDARNFCINTHRGRLATSNVNIFNSSTWYWSGWNDIEVEGVWRDALGNVLNGTHWEAGEPQGGVNENCGFFLSGSELMRDNVCSYLLGFVCEVPKYTSKRLACSPGKTTETQELLYYDESVTPGLVNWSTANNYCQSIGAQLVTPVTEQDVQDLISRSSSWNIGVGEEFWTGWRRLNDTHWQAEGSNKIQELNGFNWMQPNPYPNQYCIVVKQVNQMGSQDCDITSFRFVCERII